MAKKSKEKKSGASGKMIFGVVLAVGSAVTAYVVSKLFSKKGELAQSTSDSDLETEMAEDNYITLDNEVVAEEAEVAEQAEASAEEAVEEEMADTVIEAAAEEDETVVIAEEEISEEDATKCIKD